MLTLRLLVSAIALLTPHAASSQEDDAVRAHEQIRKSLLYIVGAGASEQGIPIEVEGSGVVVTSAGIALTAFHVLDPLKAASNPPNLSARLSLKTGPEFKFETTRSLPDRDVQLIKLVGAASFTPAPCFSSESMKPGDVVLTSGFPIGDYYSARQGTVVSTDGPRGTVIASLPSSKSQSGSPVYDPTGRVVGILKGGVAGNETLSAIIPASDFSDLLPDPARNCRSSPMMGAEGLIIPGGTAWIFAGYFDQRYGYFTEEPRVSVPDPFVDLGSVVEVRVSRPLVIMNFETLGSQQNMRPPTDRENIVRDSDLTGVVAPPGTRFLVRDKAIGSLPGRSDAALWLRVTNVPE